MDYRVLIKVFFSIFLFFLQVSSSKGDGEVFTHLSQCCIKGTEYSASKGFCTNLDDKTVISSILGDEIPPIWRGLCIQTLGICCAKELEKQSCIAGRKAAKIGSTCNINEFKNSNNSSASLSVNNVSAATFSTCCKSCQIGLAVAVAGNDCSSSALQYFSKDESFIICCNEIIDENANEKRQKQEENHENNNDLYDMDEISDDDNINRFEDHDQHHHLTEEQQQKFADGTFILSEDDDICQKIPNLCSQICINTKESYVCKCHDGYKLDSNRITCSPIDQNDSEGGEGHSTYRDDNDECAPGFAKNRETNECEDINECLLGISQCRHDQKCYNTKGDYVCVDINEKDENTSDLDSNCDPGYKFDESTAECIDIDECVVSSNPCEFGYVCINHLGSYECRRSYFHNSTRTRYPTKLPNSTTVIHCKAGYRSKHNKCIDIDECIDKNACDSNSVCINEEGSHRCECKVGFQMDRITNACVDINECQINNHSCLPSSRCDNTIGSYVCSRLLSCGTGYTLNAETNKCDDDDECTLGTHDCPPIYECRNTVGSFRCDRKRAEHRRRLPVANFSIAATTSTSTTSTTTTTTSTTTPPTTTLPPIVTMLTASTSRAATIIRPTPNRIYVPNNNRVVGNKSFVSYQSRSPQIDYSPTSSMQKARAQLPCDKGFQRNYRGACVDIDECRYQNSCAPHERCINTNGSYQCRSLITCTGGYRPSSNGSTCVDINECETGEHNCGPNEICRNRLGGYICQCPPGHMPESNSNRCIDIDECEARRDPICGASSTCLNTIGSYYCECKPGFRKPYNDGSNSVSSCVDVDECTEMPGLCEGKCNNFYGSYRCSCNLGYELNSDNRTCNDIDECEVHKSYPLCRGYCNNVPGSYACSCPMGYNLAQDKTSCTDIDECLDETLCNGPNEICFNIRGSFRCNVISCPHGYTNDKEQKNRCRLINTLCEGQECYQKPSAYTYNYITLVSKMIIPPRGLILFTLRGPAYFENIDFILRIARVQAPVNVRKPTEQYFQLTKEHNQAKLSLMRSLEGPMDIELELSMTVFMNSEPRGKSVSKILIIVSEYEF